MGECMAVSRASGKPYVGLGLGIRQMQASFEQPLSLFTAEQEQEQELKQQLFNGWADAHDSTCHPGEHGTVGWCQVQQRKRGFT